MEAMTMPRERRERVRRAHPAAALALILVVAFMVVLDFSIMNVALASIERELHTGAAAVQWVITGYAITFGGLLVLGGRMGDLFGRRRMFVAGIVLFSLASLAGGLAGDVTTLVAARAVQGIGAAIAAPAALSLITTTTAEGPARARALGLYGATASIGFVAGLVLGGFLVQFFDWRSVLWVNVPIGLAAAALAPMVLPRSAGASRMGRTDVGGAILVTASIATLVYGVSQGSVAGWMDWRILAAFGAAVGFGAAFLAVERRHPSPLVPLGIFRMRQLRSANAMAGLLGAWSASELLVLPLFLQLVLHYSPLVTGLAMAPQGIVGLLAASRGARIVQRIGTKALLTSSAVAAGVGLIMIGSSLAGRDYALLVVGFMIAGYGTAASAFGSTLVATQGVGPGEQGLAGGLVNMSRQVGAAIGVAIAAAVIGNSTAAGDAVGSDRLAVLMAAAAAFVAVGVAIWGIGRSDVPRARRMAGSTSPSGGRSAQWALGRLTDAAASRARSAARPTRLAIWTTGHPGAGHVLAGAGPTLRLPPR